MKFQKRHIQNLMDEVYNKWNTDQYKHMSRLDVISEHFTPLHKVAVQFGNMNYQVQNGGFSQWYFNGYCEDLGDLIQYAKRGTTQKIKHFDVLLKILIGIRALGEPKDYDSVDYYTDTCSFCSGSGYNDDEEESICEYCNGTGEDEYEEQIDGEIEYCSLLEEFDDKYYAIDEDELLVSFDEFLNRFWEDVDITEIKLDTSIKPVCKLVGTDGNVFSVIGNVRDALRKAGLTNKADEFVKRATSQHDYNDVLNLCFEYVDVR